MNQSHALVIPVLKFLLSLILPVLLCLGTPSQVVYAWPGDLFVAWSSSETDATYSVAWGDWDNDGYLDLAVGNSGQPNRVYRNEGGEELTLAWSSLETDSTQSVAWGDWDNDDDLDLAVGNEGQPNRVYRNEGGELILAWSSPEMDATYSVAWGNWDDDELLDLAVGNEGQPNRVYHNEGGWLSLAWSSLEMDVTCSVGWGDWDGDGDLDLAVGNYEQPNRVYDNEGGELILAWSSPEMDPTRSVDWGDWDNDGYDDLAVGNWNQYNRVYRSEGGELILAWSSSEMDSTRSVNWGDRDNDGDSDLAVGNDTHPSRVYDNDDGWLTLAWSSAKTDFTRSVAWGDWDNDDDLDLAVGNGDQPNRVYRNEGGDLGLAWSSSETDVTWSVAWGDWDGDGDLDLAVGNWKQPNRVYDNEGGELTLAWSSPETDLTHSVVWGDWDGDGDLDLAVGNHDQPNRVYRNEGARLTLVWSSPEVDTTRSVAWGDWDGDGDLDLAVGNQGQPNRVYDNEGGELMLAWTSSEADATRSVAWGDWDGDGDLDLAVGNEERYDDGCQCWRNDRNRVYDNEDGELTLAWSSPKTDLTQSVAWGDWDGDGDLDLAVGNRDQRSRVYDNDGGWLALAWSSPGADDTYTVAWGDWNGDGDLDLAVANWAQPNRVYSNKGGELTLAWSSPETDDTRSVAWGDWDGDGDLDLVSGSWAQPNRVYRNEGEGLTLAWSLPGDDDTRSVAWGDRDGDGDLDLAVGNRDQPNRVYDNEGGELILAWTSPGSDWTRSVAWGDWDGDGDLDLAVGNHGQSNRVYNNEDGELTLAWSSLEADVTRSVAWGDWDSDGDLDLAVGNKDQPTRVYDNEGGELLLAWSSPEVDNTRSVAWGDWDGDGDLDLAVGNQDQPNRVYDNEGKELNLAWSSPEADDTRGVVWGDWDGDGDPDLAVGNWEQPNQVYNNEDGEFILAWSSPEADDTYTLDWGDWDNDGDLDLAVGNWARPNRVYRNEGGGMFLAWSSSERDLTRSLAWGDWDNDGDLDLAVGSQERPNRVYRNHSADNPPLPDSATGVQVVTPGPARAPLFASATVLQAPALPITYTLFDSEGHPARFVRAFYSPNGGGRWFPATGITGTAMIAPAASPWPTGTAHVFLWDVQADLIKSDNVVFRLKAYQGFVGPGPYQWLYRATQSLPFRVQAAQWYVKAVDDKDDAVADATIYADGQPITHTITGLTMTNRAGLLNPGPLDVGTALAALTLQAQAPTARATHDGWAYRVYLTSEPFTVTRPGEQRLIVAPTRPLVLFNLLVSVEWDASDAYLAQIARAVRHASDYLYDLTDGQMAFGQVHIYDDAQYWADADVQISTKNIVRPHAYIGGLTSDDKSHVIRLGRGWDGHSGNQGAWDQPDGYHTLAHEFGHYALQLYDEYFAYVFDAHDNLIGEAPAYCTGPENRDPASEATSASVMDYQYTTSELSARDVPGLWSDLCEQTAQWQLNEGESAWETLVRVYTDTVSSPRWQFKTPMDRGAVLAGPDGLRSDLPAWPLVEVHQTGSSAAPRQLTVYDPRGPYGGAIVALYKSDGRVIGQGFTDQDGRLDIYGAANGDVLRAAAMDGGLAGRADVGAEPSLTLTLTPVGGITVQAFQDRRIPHVRVLAEPGASPDQIELLISLRNFGSAADPIVVVTEPGSETAYAPTMSYSPVTGAYEGQIHFDATERGMGRIRAGGLVDGRAVRLQSTYRLQRVLDNRGYDVYSDDGNLSLHLEPGSLPGDEAYLVVMPPGALPGPLPVGWMPVGDPYDVTASGALWELAKPAVLKLRYDGALLSPSLSPQELKIYRWEPHTETWHHVPGTLDERQNAITAPVTALGIYALLAPSDPWQEPPHSYIFLPVVLKDIS